MKALVYHGPNDKRRDEVPDPEMIDPTDQPGPVPMESKGNAVAGGFFGRRQLPRLTISSHASGKSGGILRMPAPRTALRHAVPVVLEAVVVPLALFYTALLLWGFRSALIAALGWSFLALARRLHRG